MKDIKKQFVKTFYNAYGFMNLTIPHNNENNRIELCRDIEGCSECLVKKQCKGMNTSILTVEEGQELLKEYPECVI